MIQGVPLFFGVRSFVPCDSLLRRSCILCEICLDSFCATLFGVSASDNDRGNSNADDDNDNDDDATRVDLRAMQRAEATKRFSTAQNPTDFIKLGQKFWKSCIDIFVSLEIAMLENDSTALRGVANVNNSSNGTAQESTDGALPDKTKVEKNIQALPLGFKNFSHFYTVIEGSWFGNRDKSRRQGSHRRVFRQLVHNGRERTLARRRRVNTTFRARFMRLPSQAKSIISKYQNRDETEEDCLWANLNGRSLAAWRNVIWGPASLHLATTATSCVQIENCKSQRVQRSYRSRYNVVAEIMCFEKRNSRNPLRSPKTKMATLRPQNVKLR